MAGGAVALFCRCVFAAHCFSIYFVTTVKCVQMKAIAVLKCDAKKLR